MAAPSSTRAPAFSWRPASPRAVGLALLAVLFALQVVGQALAVDADARWLPAVEHWQSGLLPYPLLLAAQVLILAVLATLTADVWRGTGRFAAPGQRIARAIRWVAVAYAGAMAARYAASMALHPAWRWFGHAIPIAFHLVLAAFLGLYARGRGGASR